MPKEYGTPGPRAIYPDVCTSRSLAACSIEAQLLFDRLIAQADDQGRIEGDAIVIKSLCVPLVDLIPARTIGRGPKAIPGIDDRLAELEAEELIHRYQAGRSSLTQIVTWWRWQQGMRRAYASRWPAPEGWTDAVYGHGEASPATYKAFKLAADESAAPHSAAFRPVSPRSAAETPDLPQDAAPSRARAAAGGARSRLPNPAEAGASAEAGAGSLPEAPQPPASGGRPSRANGTSPRQVAAREAEQVAAETKGRRWRRQQRELAYHRGALTHEQLAAMNERDAPLHEIPDWGERVAALQPADLFAESIP